MPSPYDYTVAQPNVSTYFDAMRQGRTDRLTAENDQRMNALAKYLPGALEGDKDQQALAMRAAPVDQMAGLKDRFLAMDAQSLATLRQNQTRAASLAQWADTPEKWAVANAEIKKFMPNAPDLPFEQRGMVIAQAQTVAEQLEQAWKAKAHELDVSRTTAQNAASYASAEASRALANSRGAGGGAPLTATDKNAILDADQQVIGNKAAVGLLQRARALSKNAYSGPAANTRGEIAAFFGGSGGEATLEFDNLLQQQVLPQLKAIFGGQPTEGERKILLDLQGSSRLPHNVRVGIIDTALELATARLKFNEDKARDLRGGDYYKKTPDYPNYSRPTPTQGGLPIARTQAEYDALPSGAEYLEPDGKKYRKP